MGVSSIKAKVAGFVIFLCVIVSGMSGVISYQSARVSLEDSAFRQLTSIQTHKAHQVESYFKLIEDQLLTLAQNPTTLAALTEFKAAFRSLDGDLNVAHNAVEGSVDLGAPLEAYYRENFLSALEKGSGIKQDLLEFFPKDLSTRYLQNHYIARNEWPEGEKNNLMRAPADDSDYGDVHTRFHTIFKDYQKRFGYYDIFLIDYESGDILYSVFKEVDFATNLRTGAFRNSNLALAYRNAKELDSKNTVAFIDFDYYTPSYGAPAAFFATQVYSEAVPQGVVVFQLPVDRLNTIMTDNYLWRESGLGETGETYLVGDDFLMRSVSRFLVEDRTAYLEALRGLNYPESTIAQLDYLNTSILLQKVSTAASIDALAGIRNTVVTEDYRGVKVLSAYGPISFGNRQWGLLSEIDTGEAFFAVHQLSRSLLLSAVILALVMGMLGVVVARKMLRPLVDLSAAAADVGMGNLYVELDVSSNDEIGQLSQNFNNMVVNIREQRDTIAEADAENDKLLLNVLPQPIAERLKSGETQIADAFQGASIIFCDLVGFTRWSRGREPMEVLAFLDELFTSFDQVAVEFGVEKIKTIGDAYMAVCGLPKPNVNHAQVMAQLSHRILGCLDEYNQRNGTQIEMRIGLHCGPVVAGVIGSSKFIYDLWGESINMASRMESTGIPNKIQVSDVFYAALNGTYEATPRGKIDIKGVGEVFTYILGERAVISTVDL